MDIPTLPPHFSEQKSSSYYRIHWSVWNIIEYHVALNQEITNQCTQIGKALLAFIQELTEQNS